MSNHDSNSDSILPMEKVIVDAYYKNLANDKKLTIEVATLTGVIGSLSYLLNKFSQNRKEFIFLDNNRLVYNKLSKGLRGLSYFVKLNFKVYLAISVFLFGRSFIIKNYFTKLEEERILERKLNKIKI